MHVRLECDLCPCSDVRPARTFHQSLAWKDYATDDRVLAADAPQVMHTIVLWKIDERDCPEAIFLHEQLRVPQSAHLEQLGLVRHLATLSKL